MTKDAAEVFSLDKFHGNELRSPGFAEVENSHYVFVSYIAGENQFLLEPLQDARIRSQFRPDHLERNGAVEFLVACLVNRTHAALPQDLQNLIASADQRSGSEYRA